MKLPYRNRAYIPSEKINNYLLSLTHNKGKHKATFFGKIGFNITNKDLFEKALLIIAYNNEVTNITDSIDRGIFFGKKYEIIGQITGPLGSENMKTIWIILKDKRKPKLVTARPV